MIDLRLVAMSKRQPNESWSANQYAVMDGDAYVGRIYRVAGWREEWFWGFDWFAAGQRSVNGRQPTREAAIAAFKAAWEETAPAVTPHGT